MNVDWSLFEPVATMSLNEDGQSIRVSITSELVAGYTEAVYAWIDAKGVEMRVGTSMHPLGPRLRAYQNHINRALVGLKSPTPVPEAHIWLGHLRAGDITAVAHQPPLVDTIVGRVRPYLNIERSLIRATRPCCNRTHN